MDVRQAKEALDRLIAKQRVHLYKPIQIAEILYRVRQGTLTIDQLRDDLESYRNPSKHWRDSVSRILLDRVCTSSQKFQDNLFDPNAIPPATLAALAEANEDGVVERYIYRRFQERQQRILKLGAMLSTATPGDFHLSDFLAEFEHDKGIKRSIDKAFEIVVYALFDTLVRHMKVTVTVAADLAESDLLAAFEDFARLLMGIDVQHPAVSLPARLYRAGATNAADRGLDILAHFNSAIQVRYITIDGDLADDISWDTNADRVVFVCKDGEREFIERICRQLGQRIQGIIVQSQLIAWYDLALHGEFADCLGDDLLSNLSREFRHEFPFSETFADFYRERGYDALHKPDSPFWLE